MTLASRDTLTLSSLAATIAIAAVLMACGSNSTAPRTPTARATTPTATVVAIATSIEPVGTFIAPPASTSVPDSTPPPTPTMRLENSTPSALLPDVRLADSDSTVRMHVGQSFLLNLGSDGWSVTVADQAVVSRIMNIAVVRGAQGVYLAHAPGQTTLVAIGPSPCPNAVPACEAPVRAFHVTIVVA